MQTEYLLQGSLSLHFEVGLHNLAQIQLSLHRGQFSETGQFLQNTELPTRGSKDAVSVVHQMHCLTALIYVYKSNSLSQLRQDGYFSVYMVTQSKDGDKKIITGNSKDEKNKKQNISKVRKQSIYLVWNTGSQIH